MACPLMCAHCITESGPRVKNEMTTAEALQYIRNAQGTVDHVCFTGGEPFLRRSRLEWLIREAKRRGYIVSVMTSGYWAVNSQTTEQILGKLHKLGLSFVGVSLDQYHLPFVKEDYCVHIAEAADALGLQLGVRIISPPGDTYGAHVKELLSHTKAHVKVNFPVCLGRAERLPQISFNSCSAPPRERCETVTAVDIVPGGDVYACCGPGLFMKRANPLVLGNAKRESLRAILERSLDNPFMKVINTRGPVGLLEDLRQRGRGNLVPIRGRYTDACQLCLDICNDPVAVEALRSLYSDLALRREQNALQFLKLFAEYRATQEAQRKAMNGEERRA
jgi:MoaA/NifB/PqqE/SkfB family radical SAM enzyme